MHLQLVLASALALVLAAHSSAASLTLLPDWMNQQSIRALWMMPDGETFTGVEGESVFRWSMAAGRTDIGTLPLTIESMPVRATAVSDDGSTLIGNVGQDVFQPSFGFRWSTYEGLVSMTPPAGSPNVPFIPEDLSSDGSVIVGSEYGWTQLPWGMDMGPVRGFRWTADAGTTPLEGVQMASAVSSDGSVVVGRGPLGDSGDQAVRWTASTGAVGLGIVPGSQTQSASATFVSDNGTAIVGYGSPPDARIGPKVFRWTDATGMQPLSTLGDDQTLHAVSADGTVIVGTMRTLIPDAGTFATTFDYFVWTLDGGFQAWPQLFSQVVSNDQALSPNIATSVVISGISSTGRIFGATSYLDFTNSPYLPAISRERWVLDHALVPEPSAILLSFSAFLLTASRRRLREIAQLFTRAARTPRRRRLLSS